MHDLDDGSEPLRRPARERTTYRRRTFLRLALVGAGGTALAGLTQACGTQAPATAPPAAPAKPAEAAKPVETKPAAPAAPAATTAPAASSAPKPGEAAKPAADAKPAAPAAGAVKRGGALILGTAQTVQHLDPHKAGLRNNRNTWSIFNGLTRWNNNGEPEPELAASWEAAPDGLTWTFKLRPNVTFHNGRPLTADDVKFSVERVQAKETASPVALPISEVQTVEMVDPSTVRFKLSAPSGALLAGLIDVMIVAKENVADIDTKAIGTGPFKLKEYLVNDKVTLEKNPEYWEAGADGQPLPYLDSVTVRTLTDPTALFTALTTGTVDVFWQMPPQFVVQLERSGQANVLWSKLKTIYNEFFFEYERGVFKDKRAREGLLLALDKQAIADAGYFGFAEPRWNNNIIAPGTWAEKADIPEVKRDAQKAKQLLEAAGVKEFKFLGTAQNAEWKPVAEVMERNLNEIGVKLVTEMIDLNAWYGFIGARRTKPWNDENGFAPNIAFRPPEPALTLSSWGCRSHTSSYFCNEEMDKYATEGRRAQTQDARKAAYAKYQELWAQEIPAIINSYRGTSHGSSKRTRDLASLFGDLEYRRVWLEA